MDHETFDVRGRWEIDRGLQELAYDAWWHLGYDTLVTSEWGLPETFENGLVPEVLLGSKYGRRLHFWDLHSRKHLQTIDLGERYQLVFELRPAHDRTKTATPEAECRLSRRSVPAEGIGSGRQEV